MRATRLFLAFAIAAGSAVAASAATRAHQDVRIGDPRVAAKSVDLDFHRGTGNLFAAVAWGDAWTLNISTDGGATWQETYEYPAESVISMKVAGDYVWVAYSASPLFATLRMRRFFVGTGLPDTTYGGPAIDDFHPATVVDVAMTSNADDVDGGIFIGCIGSDNAAYFYWDDLNGTSFDAAHPGVTNAEGNLDITINPWFESGYFLFMSYEGSDGHSRLHVWRLSLFTGWEETLDAWLNSINPYTAISAFADTVVAVVEGNYTYGRGIRQFANTNAGEAGEWTDEIVYAPGTTSTPEAAGPDISLRSPYGSIVTYAREDGSFDPVDYRYRSGHGPAGYENHVTISELDSAAQEQTTVEWLGARCVNSYGIVYLSGGDFAPYFDLATPRAFFCDGFESGDTSAWN